MFQGETGRLRALLVEDFRRGDPFLTERRISEKFQVSRATANKALASLVSEGLLEFRKGRGTFVRCEVIDYDLQALVSFTEKAKVAGKQPRTRVLEFRTTSASQVSPEMPDTLKVDPGEPLWEMQRLRLADATAVILEHRYVVQNLRPELTERDVQGSLYAAWTQKHGLRIGGADDVIRAVAVKGQAARLLEVPPRLRVLASLRSINPWSRTSPASTSLRYRTPRERRENAGAERREPAAREAFTKSIPPAGAAHPLPSPLINSAESEAAFLSTEH